MAAGLLADPCLDTNEIAQDWVGRQDWTHETEFDWTDDGAERVDLVFEGLDTFATVALNGRVLGETRNMHRTYRFDATPHLRRGANRLTVAFRSCWAVGEELARAVAPRPANYPGPANLMRKMACNFGWDWGPTVVTCGIWKPVRLESWSGARLAEVRPLVGVQGNRGTITLDVALEGSGDDLVLLAEVGGVTSRVAVGGSAVRMDFSVPEPRLWWPHGLGDQPLYELTLRLLAGERELDRWTRRVGFRSLRLDTSPDGHGAAFAIVVNDTPVWACGANWIPDDCFLPRVTPERYRERVAQAKAANINLLRVWGGIYETDAFYEACDEAGILVWQDFLFACAAYPEEGEFPAEIEAEARDNIVRLMPHPSLVLWNGNNENIWGWFDWGWQGPLGDLSWGRGYYLDLLPRLVEELDPSRPYWAGSPYSGSMDIHPNDPDHGCTHVWDVWNEKGHEHYRDIVPRFCSEFGWQAPPTWATLRTSVRGPLAPDSPGVLHHQKATDGNGKLLRGLDGHLPRPGTMDDWHFATQLNQARAIANAIEHWRSHRGRCMGAVVWQLNDCWPVTSWSAIDGQGRPKPLWYALRRAFAPHFLTIQPRGEGLAVVAVNDAALFWRQPVQMRRIRFDGTVLAEATYWRLCADRFTAVELPIPPEVATPEDPSREVILATMGESTARWYFAEDADLALPEPRVALDLRPEERGYRVTVEARSFVKDLCLFADRLDPAASVDEMLVTLLPGESRAFHLRTSMALSPAALAHPPVLRSANDLVAR
ncbi:Beta-mannosidase [Rubellimicrobium mesophilum DSM 19309]|uniref:beta-mannosidase n=2 Tax=Rubellimicrobium TaxID=295418 RepID=A0A017HTU4_9RHOB|nr:Beta-mannosidase [Rubellimicrobium mesophilum DSM 19309]